jgi:NAD(P)-dependent dehydrogenase (short-subunit alcohol dehydrogenase family)
MVIHTHYITIRVNLVGLKYTRTGMVMAAKKIAIVTGNYKGLGKAISELLPSLGYESPLVIRRTDYDLCDAKASERLVHDVIAQYGRLDLLVNNVGDFIYKNISDISVTEWHEMMNSNLNSAFYMCHYALPHLRTAAASRGASEIGLRSLHPTHILNIGYTGAEHFRSYPNTTAYQAAKAGLLTLTKGLAKAEAPNNVLVNMLSPGHLENSVGPYNVESIGLKRLATMAEACSVAELLITHTYLTGQNIEVAGGWGL